MSCGLFNSHYFVTENNPSIVPGIRVQRFRLISTAHKHEYYQVGIGRYTLSTPDLELMLCLKQNPEKTELRGSFAVG